MHKKQTVFIRFILAWAITFIFASVFHSQSVLMSLNALDIDISVNQWVNMTRDDLIGLLPTYGILILIALILAFTSCHYVIKTRRTMIFTLAGAVSIWVLLFAMQPIMNITLIAGARDATGILLQCIAGAAGGYVYGALHSHSLNHSLNE